MAIVNSTANGRPGLVSDGPLRSLAGEALRRLGTGSATLAAELSASGMWEHSDDGYRILDARAVQLCRRGRGARLSCSLSSRTWSPYRAGSRESFRCAACGEKAAVVKVTRTGTTVDMGPPLGQETYARDAIVVDYFLGTASRFADAATLDAAQEGSSPATHPTR